MSDQQQTAVVSRYLELVTQYPLRPIRSEAELDRAIAMADSLTDHPNRSIDEDDYLQVLGDLIHRYEQSEHPIPQATDAELLLHLIEEKGVTATELAASTKISEATISLLLSGKRAFTDRDCLTLAHYFHLSSNTFANRL